MHDVMIDEQIGGDRHAVVPVRFEGRRAGGRIAAVVQRAYVMHLHQQELLAPCWAVVVGQDSCEAFAFGVGRGGTTRREGLGMLDRALTGGGRLLGSDAEREVTVHGDVSASGLVDNRKVDLPGDVLIHLDEIGAIRGQLVHYRPGLRRGAHDDLLAHQVRIAIDSRAGAEESWWAATASLRQLALDRVSQLERHVAVRSFMLRTPVTP